MTIKRFLYDTNDPDTIIHWLDVLGWPEENSVSDTLKKGMGLSIPIDTVYFNSHEELQMDKVYYYPNTEVKALEYEATDFRQKFGLWEFFDPVYITSPSFSFMKDGKTYTFLTNCEYTMKFVFTREGIHLNLYFNVDTERRIIKLERGLKSYPSKYKVYLPPLEVVSYDIFDYLVFDNFTLSDVTQLPNIRKEKEWLESLFKDLDFQFIGSSVYDYARDLDVYINPTDFEIAVQRLTGAGMICDILHNNQIAKTTFSNNIGVDLIVYPTNTFSDMVEENSKQLIAYYIQTIYACDYLIKNHTILFSKYRLNKVMNTQKKMNMNHIHYSSYKEYTVSSVRSSLYLDLIKNGSVLYCGLDLGINKEASFKIIQYEKEYYLILKNKGNNPINTNLQLPFLVNTFEVVDGNNYIDIIQENDGSSLLFVGLNDYLILKLK